MEKAGGELEQKEVEVEQMEQMAQHVGKRRVRKGKYPGRGAQKWKKEGKKNEKERNVDWNRGLLYWLMGNGVEAGSSGCWKTNG